MMMMMIVVMMIVMTMTMMVMMMMINICLRTYKTPDNKKMTSNYTKKLIPKNPEIFSDDPGIEN